ncbi:hypothetical protein [Asticcacaulis sp.]|uniref:DUF4870 family protein n=1 Tax=Asticcacaulis sp. TaxID=1872648 RepID=UPI00262CA18D|nr:hypothetical protein [Asticcacaulis sp.]
MTQETTVVTSDTGSAKGLAIACYVCHLIGLGIIGLIIAYVKRGDARGTPFESHFTFAIRTFWIGFVGLIIGSFLSLIFIGYLVLLAVGVWWLVRCVIGIVKALDNKPITNPQTWLV